MRLRSNSICALAGVLSTALVAGCWLWSSLMLAGFQRQEGMSNLSSSPRSGHYEFWGLSLPAGIAGNLTILCAVFCLVVMYRRREFAFLTGMLAYFVGLGIIGALMFTSLSFDAFD